MLSVHEVTTAYQGLVAISAVSIEVAKGEIVCVAGANGAGKSTLLKSGEPPAVSAAVGAR
jgi:branched-chain amino acid transport system ATP-binding protein